MDKKKTDTQEIKDNIEKVKKEKKQDKDEQKKEDKTAQVKAVDEKDKKIAELTDTLQRLQAEFENFQKRCEKGNSEFRSYAAAEVIEKFLPILDSFELALKHSANHAEFVKGVELIYGQLYDMIEKQGVRPIRAVGCKFDCYRHEVLLTEKTDKEEEDEKIVEELQKGYMFKDKVLRFSKVKVLKKCQ